jgi:hypothetical protein
MKHFAVRTASKGLLTQVQVAGTHVARTGMSAYEIAIVAFAALVVVATLAFAIRRRSTKLAALVITLGLLGVFSVASPTAALALGKF